MNFNLFELDSYRALDQVKFIGSNNEKLNHEFQNALWDSERFHAYDKGLFEFYGTKVNPRSDLNGTDDKRSSKIKSVPQNYCN
jgi:hypothetical protein